MDNFAHKNPKRVSIYIDGFNLYHRILENNPDLKWLCLRTLFSKFVFPNNPILRIKYFTAKVDPYSSKETARQARQFAYWKALESENVEIIKGRLESRKRECRAVCQGTFSTMSEKMSDVKLALHLYRDFKPTDRDITCLMSADLDFVPALEMIREADPKCDIRVVLPTLDEGIRWSRAKDFSFVRLSILQREWLQKSQFPDALACKSGEEVKRPDTWRPFIH